MDKLRAGAVEWNMRAFLAGVAAFLAASCTSGPHGSAVIRVSPDGVGVAPVISGRVGGVGVSVSP